MALALFNAGVELGQLLFIGGGLLLVAIVRQASPRWTLELRAVAAHAIGTLAAFWWIERVASWF